MACSVRVRTGARLHFGLWGIHAPTGRRFGGVGMMIAEPGVDLTAQRAEHDHIEAVSPEIQDRVAKFLRGLRSVHNGLPSVAIQVTEAIASHQGLGSGTQLALATAAAVLRVAGDQSFDAAVWAHQLGRGERSSIGVHGFESGGFIVEAGQRPGDRIGERIARLDVCPDWRIVLITPPQSVGLSGLAEQTAFQQLGPMDAGMTAELRRLAVNEWLPAMTAYDFAAASGAMWEYGQLAGEYFRPVQGGVFAAREMEALSRQLRAAGYEGIAQTSWGPTMAVLCENQFAADSLITLLAGNDSSLRIVTPKNEGARITRKQF